MTDVRLTMLGTTNTGEQGNRTLGLRWRLLAGNGRALGVSYSVYDTEPAAVAAFAEICYRSHELVAVFHHHDDASTAWTWSTRTRRGLGPDYNRDHDHDHDHGLDEHSPGHGPEHLATGLRGYARRGTCAAACDRFLATITAVTPADLTALLHTRAPGEGVELGVELGTPRPVA